LSTELFTETVDNYVHFLGINTFATPRRWYQMAQMARLRTNPLKKRIMSTTQDKAHSA